MSATSPPSRPRADTASGLIADSTYRRRARRRRLPAVVAPSLALGLTRVPMRRHANPGDWSCWRMSCGAPPQSNADVVHGHGAKGGAYARLAFRSQRAVRAYTPHGGSLLFGHDTLAGKFYLTTEKFLMLRGDLFLFESAYSSDIFRRKIGTPRGLARSRGPAAARSASSSSTKALSRPAVTSARAASRKTSARCSGGGGSASARSSRPAAACGAPLSIAARAACRNRASTQPSPARRHPGQMGGHLPRRGPVSVQQPGRAAMGAVLAAAVQRRLKRITDHRVHEPRPVTSRQHLGPDKTPASRPGDGRRQARDRRRVTQFAAISQHGQRLSQAKRARTQAPHPGDHLPGDCLQPSASNSAGSSAASGRPLNSATRSNSVRYSGLPPQAAYTAAHSSRGRLAARRGVHHRTHRFLAQQRRAQHLRRRTHRQQRGYLSPRGHLRAAPPASPPPAPPAAAPGRPASAATAHQPTAHHRRRSAAAGSPPDWPPASTSRATLRTSCHPPAGRRARQTAAAGPLRQARPEAPLAHRPQPPLGAARTAGVPPRRRNLTPAPSPAPAGPHDQADPPARMPPQPVTSCRYPPGPRTAGPGRGAPAAPRPPPARAHVHAASPPGQRAVSAPFRPLQARHLRSLRAAAGLPGRSWQPPTTRRAHRHAGPQRSRTIRLTTLVPPFGPPLAERQNR